MRGIMEKVASKMGYEEHLMNGDYYVVDTETTGTDPATSVIWQLAAVLVKNHEIIGEFNRIIAISRTQYDSAYGGKLSDSSREADRQKLYTKLHLDWERIQKDGNEAPVVMKDFVEFLAREPEFPVLGHNIRSFDCRFLQTEAAMHGMKTPVVIDRAVDTGVIVKAAQTSDIPTSDEHVDRFFSRVRESRRKGIYWSVEYTLSSLGLNLDSGAFHDALDDCKAVHKFTEKIISTEVPKPVSGYGKPVVDHNPNSMVRTPAESIPSADPFGKLPDKPIPVVKQPAFRTMPRNQCLYFCSGAHPGMPVKLVTKEDFYKAQSEGRFTEGPYRDSFGDRAGEPENLQRQLFGFTSDNEVLYCEEVSVTNG